MYFTIVSKCGEPVTQAGVEEFVVEDIPFGYDAVSATKTKDPYNTMTYQDDAPTP